MGLYKLTSEILSEDILKTLNFDDVIKYGGNMEKVIKKLNEFYQYDPKTFVLVKKGDYSLLQSLVNRFVEELKFL